MNRAHRIADQVRNVVGFLNRVPTESQFLSKGLLTPAEFVEAGEQLVFQCPSWQWQGCHTRKKQVFWLPPSKQYLLTRNIPCRHRVTDWDKSFCRKSHMTSEGWLVPGKLDEVGKKTQNCNASVIVRKSVECKVKTADGDEWAVRHGGESSENDEEGNCSPSLRTSTSSSAPSCSSGLGELATVSSNNGDVDQNRPIDSNGAGSGRSSQRIRHAGSSNISHSRHRKSRHRNDGVGSCNNLRSVSASVGSGGNETDERKELNGSLDIVLNDVSCTRGELSHDFVEIDDLANSSLKDIDDDGDFTVIGDAALKGDSEKYNESKLKNAGIREDNLLLSTEEDGKNQALVPTRSYDLSITYDKYYQSPRLWLFGYDEVNTTSKLCSELILTSLWQSGVPLRADAVFEDIHSDYLSKTVTVDPHPFTGVPTVSVHPCK